LEASNGHPSPINRPLGASVWLRVKSSRFDFVMGLRRIRFTIGRVCRSFESGGSVECVLPVEQLEWSKHGFRLTIWAGSMFALLRNRGSRQDFKWVAVILLNNGRFNLSVGESVTAIWTGHNPPRHDQDSTAAKRPWKYAECLSKSESLTMPSVAVRDSSRGQTHRNRKSAPQDALPGPRGRHLNSTTKARVCGCPSSSCCWIPSGHRNRLNWSSASYPQRCRLHFAPERKHRWRSLSPMFRSSS
jgi:hypothetical protein